MSFDDWFTRDRFQEEADKAHQAFQQSDAYLEALTDYVDVFDSTDAYDKAFERWIASFDEDRTDYDVDTYDEYRQLDEAEVFDHYAHIDTYGDT